MIITLKNANFSENNVGQLNSWFIFAPTVSGGVVTADSNNPSSIDKTTLPATTLKYTFDTAKYNFISCTPSVGTATHSNGLITVTIPKGTVIVANITISIVLERVGGEEEEETTNYTFTITPDPTSATVTLSATGYSTVSGTGSKSITVANGTKVNWSVSASGYTTRTGSWTISGGNKTENIVLSATSGGGGSALDLSTLSLAHCSSSKLVTGNKENLTYNQTTHELKVNNPGWYKVSYFTTPVQVGTEIEYTANYSKSITGNFVGIYKQEDLVDGITEANGSFWPAPSGFGVYAPGQGGNDFIYIWDKKNAKTKTADGLEGDYFNGKTIKLKLLATGTEVYVDGVKLTWASGATAATLTEGVNYYLGFHNNGSGAPLAQTINYIGPIR